MFMIKCVRCGREQHWGTGLVLGRTTDIEIAEGTVFCTCGNIVEEIDGVLIEIDGESKNH